MSDGAPPSAPYQDQNTGGAHDPPTVSSVPIPASEPPNGTAVWGPPLAIGLVYLAFWQIAPRIRTESVGAILLSTLLGLSLIIWFNAQIARGFRKPWQFGLSLAITAVICIPLLLMEHVLRLFYPPWSWILSVKGLQDLVTVWLATSLGGLLSFLLRGTNMIPPVAAVLALVDIWTVLLGGPVSKILKSDNPTAVKITKTMTVPLPAPELRGATPMNLVIGFADFLFIAFFVAALSRFDPSDRIYRRMLATLISVLGIYMLVVFFFGWSLPALLPLAIVMIALHWRHFQYSRSELFALLYAGFFIVLIGAGFWYMNQHFVISAKP